MSGTSLPVAVLGCTEHIAAAGRAAGADRALSMYVHGSVALGGYDPLRSDIDVLVLVADETALDAATLGDLGDRLVSVPPPGRGLELSMVTAAAARRPAPPWPLLLHVTTAPAQVVVGLDRPGDPDLLMYDTVVRAAGLTVCGEPPARTIGPVARDVVLRYLADELGWAESHAGEAYGVLNAARAGRFLDDGMVVSKIDGARDAIDRAGPAELLRRAIDVQEGRLADRAPTAAAVRYLRGQRARLTASGSPGEPGTTVGRVGDGSAPTRRGRRGTG